MVCYQSHKMYSIYSETAVFPDPTQTWPYFSHTFFGQHFCLLSPLFCRKDAFLFFFSFSAKPASLRKKPRDFLYPVKPQHSIAIKNNKCEETTLSIFTLAFFVLSFILCPLYFFSWDTSEESTAKLTIWVTVCTIYFMKPQDRDLLSCLLCLSASVMLLAVLYMCPRQHSRRQLCNTHTLTFTAMSSHKAGCI